MEKYLEKQKEIDALKSKLYQTGLLLCKRIKKLFEEKKINETQYKNADFILAIQCYNLGCCSKRYTLTGLKKIQTRFEKYNQELKNIEK